MIYLIYRSTDFLIGWPFGKQGCARIRGSRIIEFGSIICLMRIKAAPFGAPIEPSFGSETDGAHTDGDKRLSRRIAA